jgi:hypothetical protein
MIFLGKKLKIDEEMLSSYENNTDKKNKRKLTKRKSQNVTPYRLSKVFDLNTLRLCLRRARWLPDENKYDADSDILFLSNPFKPGKF